MIAVLAAAVVTCGLALIIGGAACWLCGARTWTFLAAPVGLSLMMLVSMGAIHVPGHTTTLAVVLLALALAGLVLLVRVPEMRPPRWQLLAAAPAGLLVLVPFLANGHAGTLGVSVDNDMASHLRWAEDILKPSLSGGLPGQGLEASYPLGPHALCAVLARGLGIQVVYAFAGETAALPVLIACTALAALRRVGWLGKALVATMVGLTYLVAGYYVQGSFKELMQAMFVLAFALGLERMRTSTPADEPRTTRSARARWLSWVPLAVLVGGSLSVYSVTGLPWFVAILGVWLLVDGAMRLLRRGARELMGEVRAAVAPVLIGAGVIVILLVPQLPRLVRFYESSAGVGGGTGIPTSNLGNLVEPIVFWKVFGMWDVADYRLPAIEPVHAGVLAGLGLAATVGGLLWWLSRGEWVVPLAAGVATLIWVYSDREQSPYVAAKALVILAPLVMLLATRWLVEPRAGESWMSWIGGLRLVLVGLLAWGALGSSVKVLRSAYVGPTTHYHELRSLQPVLGRSRTLFLGWDDFLPWELLGTAVQQPYLAYLAVPVRPQKAWQPGEPFDFDDFTPEVLDSYRFVVGPRDPAGSEPPSNMHLVRATRFYDVWERVGPTPARQILDEGVSPGAVLNCATSTGRAIAHEHGIAAIRSPNVEVPVPVIGPGSTLRLSMKLPPGKWWLTTPYTSPHPVTVSAPGLHVVLPANLDRLGNRWLIGEITVSGHRETSITVTVAKPALADPLPTIMTALIATRAERDRIVPLADACGRYVDWYEPA